MSSENYKADGYGQDMELAIFSHQLFVSHPRRSGCRAKSVHLKPA